MSLRWRITLLTAALIAISVLLVGVGIYLVAARIQLSTVDRSLSAALTDTRVRALATRSTSAADDEEVAIGIGRVAARTGVLTVLRHAGTTAEQVPFPTLSATDLAAASVGPITVPGSLTSGSSPVRRARTGRSSSPRPPSPRSRPSGHA